MAAAERDSSVSALVREFLTHLAAASGESDFDRRKRLQDDILSTVRKFSASERLARADVHRRAVR